MTDKDALMTPFQKALWKFLRENFVGIENMTPRRTVQARFYLLHESMRTNDRIFREAISELVTVYKKPICSTPSGGYFVGRTMQEIEPSGRALMSAGSKTVEHGRALLEAIPLEQQGRLPL